MSTTSKKTECLQDWLGAGQCTVLRPVLEADIDTLAALLAEAPLGIEQDPYPWTASRLRRKFESSEHPGFWERTSKLYIIAEPDGPAIGYINELLNPNGGTVIRMHIGDAVPDRDMAGRDAVAAYLAMARKWGNLPRVSIAILDCEEQKQEWLTAAGFKHEVVCREGAFYLGHNHDYHILGWVSEWALANRDQAGDTGE